MRLRYDPRARGELREAIEYLEDERPGLGREFAKSLADLFAEIASLPASGTEIVPGVRTRRLLRFHYTVVYQFGDTVSLRPFLGQMGVAPAAQGRHSTIPPRRVGGNLDCRELIAGSRLVLPIEVPLALFSFGDGHGAQGDGESSVTALECPFERVVLRLSLEQRPLIDTPYARTPTGWLTMGFDEDLTMAAHRALAAMVVLMGALHGFDQRRALALASVAVDLRVTQIANGVNGVHAILADDALRRAPTQRN